MGRRRFRWALTLGLILLLAAPALVTRGIGLSAHRTPWPGEARLARLIRAWTLPREYRTMTNPVASSPDAVRAGMEHWADHCALCHGNDGSGRVPVGQALFPPAPDMREEDVQRLSDGALLYAIEEGIPFTGMPAWSTGTDAERRSSWELVQFIRYLPRVTPQELQEMERLNPTSAADRETERQIQEFLMGNTDREEIGQP